ncbi:MAG: M23 family metallopeptidase [Deltaproteobacteria bacterium]|nr:M23 family metallopeptidase [Deltaproteobacteria bacterium]
MSEGRGPLKIRGFTLPAWLPVALVAVAVAVAAGLSVYSFHANRAISGFEDRSYELEILQTENAAKEIQVAALTERLAALEGQVGELSGRDRDLTLLTRDFNRQLGLPEGAELAEVWPELVNTVAWTWGGQKDQGGVDRRSGPAGPSLGSSAEVIRGLHRDLDRLEEGAAASGFVLSELSTALMGSRSLLAVTPIANPVPGAKVSSLYGYRSNPFGRSLDFHAGLDLAAPTGTSVYAPADGTVLSSDWSKSGYGLMITLDHGFGLSTRYAHLSESMVEPGQKVRRGELIARVGSTGRSTGPHLHYETRLGETAVDPLSFLQAKLEYQTAFLEEKREAREAQEAAAAAAAVAVSEASGEAPAVPASPAVTRTTRGASVASGTGGASRGKVSRSNSRSRTKGKSVRGSRTRRG